MDTPKQTSTDQALGDLQQRLDDWRRTPDEPQALRLFEALAPALAEPGGERTLWAELLEQTGRSAFLLALPDRQTRQRWADLAVEIIERIDYRLGDMLAQRAEELGDAVYLDEQAGRGGQHGWSYSRVHRRSRELAATLLDLADGAPRVALFVANSVEGALVDLACLTHDILVSPLNIHFDIEELAWIFNRLEINVAVADSEARLDKLLELREHVKQPFQMLALQPGRSVERGDALLLGEQTARRTPAQVESLLAERPRFALDEVCTVMFTSGSTGFPKGVSFSQLNLVSKRFCRAAALPTVGEGELLVAYLPLFHTFGRYLELLGMLYWRGSYVFAGNPSYETLTGSMAAAGATGLISIPLRWAQIRDASLAEVEQAATPEAKRAALEQHVGSKLRWGLSAAGYLSPRAFRYFQSLGVELCSGFGMTEATGGITMSPPGDYIEDTVGVPLPGIHVKLTEQGEMRIAGPYVARYLDPDGQGTACLARIEEDGLEWLGTGDLFRRLPDGHLTIVDRIKDIYKNSKGQTIAPRRVEKKFATVPGIERAFLVGDHRAYNVLLIVTDDDDPVLQNAPGEVERIEYFEQIVAAANNDLAPYERVVNFALLERDFSLDEGELTAKGSYRRKQIEENFSDTIAALYRSRHTELELGPLRIKLPRWFFRDLSILERDVYAVGEELVDRRRGKRLRIAPAAEGGFVRVGDLIYPLSGEEIDLGLFSRQPHLWAGNPALIAFAPCKEGWDVPMEARLPMSLLPTAEDAPASAASLALVEPEGVSDRHLLLVNRIAQRALYRDGEDALTAVRQLGDELIAGDDRIGALVRRRLTALAHHPTDEVRFLAYRVLLLDEPAPDYTLAFPAFVQSGLPFLSKESIQVIAAASFEQRRLLALRKRLASYRAQLSWPARPVVREQFRALLSLLVNFVRFHPEYYKAVRAELAAWVLHRQAPPMVEIAEGLLAELVKMYESKLLADTEPVAAEHIDRLAVFDDDLPDPLRAKVRMLLQDPTFLKQSVLLAFDESEFELTDLPAGGIWVTRLARRESEQMLRLSMNTLTGKHYDLLVVLRDDIDRGQVLDTNHWMMVIAGYPHGPRVIPRFGSIRTELQAMSLEFLSDLTAWDKIRELVARRNAAPGEPERPAWRRLFVQAMTAFFRGWEGSGRRIVPGMLTPGNVCLPEVDFRESAKLLSLAGWKDYAGPLDLFRPLHANFYRKTIAHYPDAAQQLQPHWLFEACAEGLGREAGLELLLELRQLLNTETNHSFGEELLLALDQVIGRLQRGWYMPLPLRNAIERYHAWARISSGVTSEAKVELLDGLMSLYRLDRFGEIARYYLYRKTYFADAGDAVTRPLDALLEGLAASPDISASERVELSDVQAALTSSAEREAFSRLVFPSRRSPRPLEVLALGDKSHRHVVLRTQLSDSHDIPYDVREPMQPEEVGQLYRLFYSEQLPITVSEQDRHLVTVDETGRVVGGICFKFQDPRVVHMDGVVVTATLQRRGIGGALLEDFAARLVGRGVQVLKANFIMREFCERFDFSVDRRWGGLVRFLGEADSDSALREQYPDHYPEHSP